MKEIDTLLSIMRSLREPEKGCPWDLQQNFKSIAPYTLEEAYEVTDAIERNDMADLQSELGDLLLQVIYHSQIAAENQYFTFKQVAESINKKMINRHPHVFSDKTVKTAGEQALQWDENKTQERKKTASGKYRLLNDIPVNLPATSRAQKLQSRAAKVGFDWENIDEVWKKLDEEADEIKHVIRSSEDHSRLSEELGDLLFVCVNLCRHLSIDAESALRHTNIKFEKRFRFVEESVIQQGKSLEDASLEEMDRLWEEAKKTESIPVPFKRN